MIVLHEEADQIMALQLAYLDSIGVDTTSMTNNQIERFTSIISDHNHKLWNSYHQKWFDFDPVANEVKLIDAAIASAVQDEREACAKSRPPTNHIDTSKILGWDSMTKEEQRMWRAGYFTGICDYEDAIRARNEVKA